MRTSRILAACALMVVGAVACSSSNDVTSPRDSALPEAGPVIARDSLVLLDSSPLPCCSVDSAGGTVAVVGGALTFHRLANYTDTVYTPGGPMSGACVTQTPNGSVSHLNGLVTVGDSIGYLTVPCSTGTYTLVVSRRVNLPGSPSDTFDDTLSVGTFQITNRIPDVLTLMDLPDGVPLTNALSWDTVMVAERGHQYRLVAVSIR